MSLSEIHWQKVMRGVAAEEAAKTILPGRKSEALLRCFCIVKGIPHKKQTALHLRKSVGRSPYQLRGSVEGALFYGRSAGKTPEIFWRKEHA